MIWRRWVFVAILLLAGANELQGAGPDTQWLGVLWTKGAVSVGDAAVSSGMTIQSGDVITTAPGASAWLRFRTPASTVLLADTQVALYPGDSAPSILLRRGTVIVDEKLADPFQVTLPGGFVLVKGDAQNEAECEMAAVGDAATVSVKRGLAEIHTLGGPIVLHSGQSAQVPPGQPSGPQIAGRINRVIPQGQIQRQGQTQVLPLTLHEMIDWNDLVRTLQTGRAQIMLVDGSTLNVGVRSEIRIEKHVPDKQQTEIDLISGQVQANVQKITAPGGKFELRTKSAVIGTVDTSYVAVADDKSTTVCGVAGTTRVKSSDPKITKTVDLKKNMCTTVIFGLAPTNPVVSPSVVANLMSQTAVQSVEGLSAAATAGLAVGGTAALGAIAAGVVLANSGTTSPTTP